MNPHRNRIPYWPQSNLNQPWPRLFALVVHGNCTVQFAETCVAFVRMGSKLDPSLMRPLKLLTFSCFEILLRTKRTNPGRWRRPLPQPASCHVCLLFPTNFCTFLVCLKVQVYSDFHFDCCYHSQLCHLGAQWDKFV